MDPPVPPRPVRRNRFPEVTIAVVLGLLLCLLLFLVSGWLMVWVAAALVVLFVVGFVHYKVWGKGAGSPGWSANREKPGPSA